MQIRRMLTVAAVLGLAVGGCGDGETAAELPEGADHA